MSLLPRTSAARAPRWRRFAVIGALCTALVGGAAVADGGARLPVALAVPRTDVFPASADRPAGGPGLTFLLVGIDTREGLSASERRRLHVGGKGCNCTDTMMLVHISQDRRRVGVISIPRDSYVRFPRPAAPAPGTAAKPVPKAGKINGAYALGGPALTVRTVEQATGVRVDHYLEADFTRFVKAVDRLDGATVCSREQLRDTNSGLALRAGTHRLDGRRALTYVRARHLPPSGDLGRMRRQQQFLAEVVDRFHDEDVLRNPRTLARTAGALLDTLRADENLTTDRLVTLGRALRDLDTSRTEFATVPLADFDHRVPDWGSTLLWDRQRAQRLFDAVREDRPLTDEAAYSLPGPGVPVAWSPADIRVRVHTGPGDDEAALRLERGLRRTGFAVRDRRVDPGWTRPERTRIVHPPEEERRAATLAAALPGAELRPVKGHAAVLEVRPGRDRIGVTRVVYDRSSVQGAPVTGDTLDCDDAAD